MPAQLPSNGFRERLDAAGVDRVASLFAACGAVLLLLADSILNWFRDGSGFFSAAGSNSTFADLHQLIERTARQASSAGIAQHVSFGFSRPYFGWLGWVLLVSVIAVGALAVSALGRDHFAVRFLGAVLATAGVACTLSALKLVTFEGNAPKDVAPSYGDYLKHSGVGTWCAVGGFLLVLIACLVPRRRTAGNE